MLLPVPSANCAALLCLLGVACRLPAGGAAARCVRLVVQGLLVWHHTGAIANLGSAKNGIFAVFLDAPVVMLLGRLLRVLP